MNLKDIKKKADEVRLRNQASTNIESSEKEETLDADELLEIGLHYYLGNDGYEEDNAKAFDYFSKASELGNAFASSCLGEMYFKGYHVSKNLSEAKRYLQIGVDNEVVLAMTNLADLYREEDKDGDAFDLYNKAASTDNAYSQWMLGQYYFYGIVVDRDEDAAESLFLKAAEKDDRAYLYLGDLYDGQKRYEDAFDWYKKSADAGYFAGMANLGWAYMLGNGVEENFGMAKNWLEKADEGDNSVAQFGLGLLYENGWGCPSNMKIAMSYYKKAADNGHENAQKAIQYNGFNNVPRENSNRGCSCSEIASRVKAIIVDKLGVDESEVTNEASFTNDLYADPIDTVELIMEFEKEFGVTIPDEEAETISTVGDAIDYLVEKLK